MKMGKELSGNFAISTNQSYNSSSVDATYDVNNPTKWNGWNLGWLNTLCDSIKPMAHGIYKLHYNGDPTKFIYIDYRDAITNYSPIFIFLMLQIVFRFLILLEMILLLLIMDQSSEFGI